MSLSTLQIGGFAILFCLSVLATINDFKFSKLLYINDFKFSKLLCIISWIVTVLYILIVPNRLEVSYNKNKVFTEDVIATYELLSEENDKYITVSGGKSSHPYVCYEDSDGTIKTLKLDESVKVVRDSDEVKLEKVKVEWGVIKGTAYILYLSD